MAGNGNPAGHAGPGTGPDVGTGDASTASGGWGWGLLTAVAGAITESVNDTVNALTEEEEEEPLRFYNTDEPDPPQAPDPVLAATGTLPPARAGVTLASDTTAPAAATAGSASATTTGGSSSIATEDDGLEDDLVWGALGLVAGAVQSSVDAVKVVSSDLAQEFSGAAVAGAEATAVIAEMGSSAVESISEFIPRKGLLAMEALGDHASALVTGDAQASPQSVPAPVGRGLPQAPGGGAAADAAEADLTYEDAFQRYKGDEALQQLERVSNECFVKSQRVLPKLPLQERDQLDKVFKSIEEILQVEDAAEDDFDMDFGALEWGDDLEDFVSVPSATAAADKSAAHKAAVGKPQADAKAAADSQQTETEDSADSLANPAKQAVRALASRAKERLRASVLRFQQGSAQEDAAAVALGSAGAGERAAGSQLLPHAHKPPRGLVSLATLEQRTFRGLSEVQLTHMRMLARISASAVKHLLGLGTQFTELVKEQETPHAGKAQAQGQGQAQQGQGQGQEEEEEEDAMDWIEMAKGEAGDLRQFYSFFKAELTSLHDDSVAVLEQLLQHGQERLQQLQSASVTPSAAGAGVSGTGAGAGRAAAHAHSRQMEKLLAKMQAVKTDMYLDVSSSHAKLRDALEFLVPVYQAVAISLLSQKLQHA